MNPKKPFPSVVEPAYGGPGVADPPAATPVGGAGAGSPGAVEDRRGGEGAPAAVAE